MSPDDPRHGRRSGYDQHRRDGEDACADCKRGVARAEQLRQLDILAGRARMVPILGTRRRVQALVAIGYTFGQISAELGVAHDVARSWAVMPRQRVFVRTAERVAEVYERLSMRPKTGWKADQQRRLAARRGWAPPLAWDDIDTDARPADAYKPIERRRDAETIAEWEHLRTLGVSLDQAASQLGITAASLQRAIERQRSVA